MKWQHYLLISIGMLLLFSMPWFLTRPWSHIPNSFEDTGQVGDTIGGLTAPFIGLLSAILVYIAFRQQVRANELVQEQIKQEAISREIESIDHYCKQLSNDLVERVDGVNGQFTIRDRYLSTFEVGEAAYQTRLFIKILKDSKTLPSNSIVHERVEILRTHRMIPLIVIAIERIGKKVEDSAKSSFINAYAELRGMTGNTGTVDH